MYLIFYEKTFMAEKNYERKPVQKLYYRLS